MFECGDSACGGFRVGMMTQGGGLHAGCGCRIACPYDGEDFRSEAARAARRARLRGLERARRRCSSYAEKGFFETCPRSYDVR